MKIAALNAIFFVALACTVADNHMRDRLLYAAVLVVAGFALAHYKRRDLSCRIVADIQQRIRQHIGQ